MPNTDSTKNERFCQKCGRPFNAWETDRKTCRQCDPVPLHEAQRIVRAINEGVIRL